MTSEEEFTGVTVRELIEHDADRVAALEAVKIPDVVSWRKMAPPISPWGNFLWTTRPPGLWVALVRYESELISSSASIPLNVDYAKVFEMLRAHGYALLARVSDMGLIAVAVWSPENGGTPLAPGFRANAVIDVTKLGAEGLELLSEERPNWPDGLMEPWILQMKSAHDLGIKREEYMLKAQGKGIWLLTAAAGSLHIYEVI